MRPLLLLVLMALALAAGAQSTSYFVRNIAVTGRQSGGDIYVPAGQLPKYLRSSDLARVSVEGGEVRVDGAVVSPVGEDNGIPLVSLARALGYKQTSNAGIVDLTAPTAEANGVVPLADPRKRAEYQIAAERMQQILQKLPQYDDPDMLARIQKVGGKVARSCPLSSIEWKFWLVDDKAPNAACVGEGHVFVTRGLMQLGITDDELAGVLGHEIAHGVRRHCFHRVELVRDLLLFLQDYTRLRREIAAAQASGRASKSLQNRIDQYERDRVRLQYRLDNEITYSRQDEEEADVLGMRYAATAGYSPDGLASCLLKLERALVNQFGTAVLKEDMSHPPVPRRLEILSRARSNWKL